ncbi:soyasaponin III rhamnosyltransferase-like [Prunus yedoensis var. nudiflora]|uniref:Soyasaponin III rhamnosyltransferase-like n=1 Tax=Prunus yedoensis var. nudiflora TaxID=2094558 RepID=A0A314Y5Q9_PRUYE|nr:soyasaponin III rhamnosyltransferase-like [Prunus yedoensis var. nudiflora]
MVKNITRSRRRYALNSFPAQANLGLSNDGMESSLLREEQTHTRNDASDNYKDTHECLQQIEQLIHIREDLHMKSGKMSGEVKSYIFEEEK